jgi:Amt family ammonium transporter
VGGILGTILGGFFVSRELGVFSGQGLSEGVTVIDQLSIQTIGVVSTFCYTAIVTYIILKIIDAKLGLRTSKEDEDYGLDTTQHNERGYDL